MSRPLRVNTIRVVPGSDGVYLLLSFNDKGRHWSSWTTLVLHEDDEDDGLEVGRVYEIGAIWLREETERLF